MHLSPQEKDKLLIVTAALLAERRLNRGLKLNHPEATAWLSFLVLEGARDGKSVAELMQHLAAARSGHGWRLGTSARGADRGRLSRWHQTRHPA